MTLFQPATVLAISPEIARRELSHIRLSPPPSLPIAGVALDLGALTPEESSRIDDGELLSRWLMRWLAICEQLPKLVDEPLLCTWTRKPGLLGGVQVNVEPLRADDLMVALCGPARLGTGAVAIAWGIDPDQRAKVTASTRCQGVLAPALDALAIVWAASSEQLPALALGIAR